MIPACLPPLEPSRPKVLLPDVGHLFELFQSWTPDKATQHRILVTNPAKLYRFPN
jgi:predicted TIM-barrel fold metal-dependent hydrolase